MKNNKKNNRGKALKMKKFKRGVLFFTMIVISLLVYVNTRFVGNRDAVYAQLCEQYGKVDDLKEESSTPEVPAEEVSEEISSSTVKNLNLTADMDLRTRSNISAEEADKMLAGTNLKGLGSAFVKAEQMYDVNALYMIGLACLESAYGTSTYAKERNNLFGWNAVDSNPNKASSFKSKEDAILLVAKSLQKNYLRKGGAYYAGYSARAIDVHYCTDKAHADKIVSIVNRLKQKLA